MASKSSCAFRCPSHPHFGNGEHIATELLEENLHNLAEDNEKYFSSKTLEDGCFTEGIGAGIARLFVFHCIYGHLNS